VVIIAIIHDISIPIKKRVLLDYSSFIKIYKNFKKFFKKVIDNSVTLCYNIIKGGEKVGKKKGKSPKEKELIIILATAIINLIIALIELIEKLLDK